MPLFSLKNMAGEAVKGRLVTIVNDKFSYANPSQRSVQCRRKSCMVCLTSIVVMC